MVETHPFVEAKRFSQYEQGALSIRSDDGLNRTCPREVKDRGERWRPAAGTDHEIGPFNDLRGVRSPLRVPEFWGEVQPPASLKGLYIPPHRAVFVPWKPSRRPAVGMGNPTFR